MIEFNDPRLTAFVLGELSPAEAMAVQTAINQSPELQKAIEEIRQSVEFLKSGFADELAASELRVETLGANEVRVKDAATVSNSRQHSSNRWLWAVAMTLLAALIGYSIWQLSIPAGQQVAMQNSSKSSIESRVYGYEEAELGIYLLPEVETANDMIITEPDSGTVNLAGVKRLEESQKSSVDSFVDTLAAIKQAGQSKSDASRPSEFPDAEEWRAKAQRRIKYMAESTEGLNQEFLGEEVVELSLPESKSAGDSVESLAKALASHDRRTENLRRDEIGGGMAGKLGIDGKSDENDKYELVRKYVNGRFGIGADQGGDRYEPIIENDFLRPTSDPLSTFSIDVDTASYSKVRSYLMNYNQLPPAGAVRIEELVNYFPYNYAPPTDDAPFAAHQSIAICPWNPEHKLVRVALKGKEIKQDKRPVSNLVFLLDVSGSMNESQKLPLVKRGIKMLIDQLTENDRVAMVVYAGAAGTVLDSTTGDQKSVILGALDRLQAGGSTNGGEGIRLAYKLALDHFITGGVNRVILCTDGDFNVGTTSNDELVKLVEEQAKQNIFLSVLGFGMGNLNDSMLEQVSNRGNGNYAFIDTDAEARKVLVEQMTGTLITIAKDVKIQIEFNPARVEAYRLIGYENRVMAAQDFNNDKKDAGEIGAGHSVTALYEIVPAGKKVEGVVQVDGLKYQPVQPKSDEAANASDEILTLKLRYKEPEGDTSKLLTFPLADSGRSFADADQDFQFAAAVASFGMQLRQSKWAGKSSLDAVLEIAESASKSDKTGYRTEFLQMVRSARDLMKK